MTATAEFINTLRTLKPGELGQLRQHAGLPLDNSVAGFDLFAGLWWPLRSQSQRAPRREVAWLVVKLYAFRPLPQTNGAALASQLRQAKPHDERAGVRWQQRFDELLQLPLNQIEPALQWAIAEVGNCKLGIDWVRLVDDLSIWEREQTRLTWANQFLAK